MQKKLTVLFAFAIFVLVVGLQTDSYADHKRNHNPGGGGGGGDKVVAEYSVEIKGAVSGHSFDNWLTLSAHGITWSDPHGLAGEFTVDEGETTAFTYFIKNINNGDECFGDVEWLYGNFNQRKGSAGGSLWFEGCTDEGTDMDGNCFTEVVYVLHVFGDPDGSDWPRPSSDAPPISFDMTRWEMGLNNGQSDLFNISCIDEGNFADSDSQGQETPTVMTIEVTREN